MKIQLGDIEIQSIVESEGPFRTPAQLFDEAGDDVMAAYKPLLEPWSLDPVTGMMIFKFQSYLVRTPHHTVLIDTCVGCDKTIPRVPDWHQRKDQTWLDNLTAAGVAPEAVDFIFCTHLHVDHCGWNTQLRDGRWTPTFPNAKYIFSTAEYEASAEGGGDTFKENVLPVMEAGQAVLVDMDHTVDDNLWFQPTPGHTAGHVAVSIASNGQRASMCGDLIHTPIQLKHPEWSPVFDLDKAAAARTRRAYLEQQSESGDLTLTAHFPSPSTGRVTADGDAFWFAFMD